MLKNTTLQVSTLSDHHMTMGFGLFKLLDLWPTTEMVGPLPD